MQTEKDNKALKLETVFSIADSIFGEGMYSYREIKEIEDGYYCYQRKRGGKHGIITASGDVLVAGSAIEYKQLFDEFSSGRRNVL